MMAWVLSDPSNFGMFWPLSKEKEYGPWYERTERHFNEMPPEQKARFNNRLASYRHFIACKFSMMDGHKFNDNNVRLGPLEPHEKPDEFHTAKTHSSLGSMIEADSQLLAVDQALKDVIERLEPGVHEFWPMKIVMPKGVVYPTPFYGSVIRQFLDSFSPAQSAEGSWQRADNFESYAPRMPYNKLIPGLAFSKEGFGSAHLWREKKMFSHNILMSDELQFEIKKAALHLPKLYRVREVACTTDNGVIATRPGSTLH